MCCEYHILTGPDFNQEMEVLSIVSLTDTTVRASSARTPAHSQLGRFRQDIKVHILFLLVSNRSSWTTVQCTDYITLKICVCEIILETYLFLFISTVF